MVKRNKILVEEEIIDPITLDNPITFEDLDNLEIDEVILRLHDIKEKNKNIYSKITMSFHWGYEGCNDIVFIGQRLENDFEYKKRCKRLDKQKEKKAKLISEKKEKKDNRNFKNI